MSSDDDKDKIDPLRAAIMAQQTADQSAPDPPSPLSRSIEPEEYASWIPPPLAIKRLGAFLSDSEARAEIYQRLSGGELLCSARSATWYKSQSPYIEVVDFGRLEVVPVGG